MRYGVLVPLVLGGLPWAGTAQTQDGQPPAAGAHSPAAAACAGGAAVTSAPWIASWPEPQRRAFEQAMGQGLVVLALDACDVRVLDQCRIEAGYRFVGSESATREFDLNDAQTRRKQLHGDYLGIEARVARGEHVSLGIEAVGSYESTKALVLP